MSLCRARGREPIRAGPKTEEGKAGAVDGDPGSAARLPSGSSRKPPPHSTAAWRCQCRRCCCCCCCFTASARLPVEGPKLLPLSFVGKPICPECRPRTAADAWIAGRWPVNASLPALADPSSSCLLSDRDSQVRYKRALPRPSVASQAPSFHSLSSVRFQLAT